MKLEVGKYYRHITGAYLSILAKVNTTMWKEVLISESPEDALGLIPVEIKEESADDWKEVTVEEWHLQFQKEKEDE